MLAAYYGFPPERSERLAIWEIPALYRGIRIIMADRWIHTATITAALHNTGFKGPEKPVSPDRFIPDGLLDDDDHPSKPGIKERLARWRENDR